jgi:Abortive infection C-terminus
MQRLKELAGKYSKWSGLDTQIKRIEYQLESDLAAAIGTAKSLLESVCKTILDSEKEAYTNYDNINKLSKNTIKALGVENPNSVSQFGNAIVTAIHNLSEIRNKIDDSSHGKSLVTQQQSIDEITASFLIHSTESIACFLISFYETKNLRNNADEIKYEDFDRFNNYLDDEHGDVYIAKVPYLTSEALFAIDRTAYNDEYQKYLGELDEQAN